MLTNLIEQITPFIQQYGVIGLFFFAVIEEIAVPIPSSLPLLMAGFFLIPADLSFWNAVGRSVFEVGIPGALGLTLGGLFVYSVSYVGGEAAIKKWGKYAGVSWKKVERAREKLSEGHLDESVIFAVRAIPFLPNILISIVCGILHYPLKTFLTLTFLGSFVRAVLMGVAGWYLGSAYEAYAEAFSLWSSYIFAGVVVILIAAYLFFKFRKR